MDEPTLQALLKKGLQYQASDLLFKVGQPPGFRVNGQLHYLQGERLRPDQTRALAEILLRHGRYPGQTDEVFEFDTSYEAAGIGRYRVNVYKQRSSFAVAMRTIPLRIPGLDELGLPPIARTFAEMERGLILVVGAAGNGKSSTLAAMIGHLNDTRRCHVITIEDPVEFLHIDNLASVSQREIGLDTPSFSSALRAALRQDPDVILVGEIRDEETMEIALKAAETGHLVLSTMHTSDVQRTVGRVMSLIGAGTDARERFGDALRGIIAQRLVPRSDNQGRALAAEAMYVTGTARESIRKPEGNLPLKDVMERGTHPYGMQTFEMALRQLVKSGLVTVEAARAAMN